MKLFVILLVTATSVYADDSTTITEEEINDVDSSTMTPVVESNKFCFANRYMGTFSLHVLNGVDVPFDYLVEQHVDFEQEIAVVGLPKTVNESYQLFIDLRYGMQYNVSSVGCIASDIDPAFGPIPRCVPASAVATCYPTPRLSNDWTFTDGVTQDELTVNVWREKDRIGRYRPGKVIRMQRVGNATVVRSHYIFKSFSTSGFSRHRFDPNITLCAAPMAQINDFERRRQIVRGTLVVDIRPNSNTNASPLFRDN